MAYGDPGQDPRLNNSMAALQDVIRGMPAAIQPQLDAELKKFTNIIDVTIKQYQQQQAANQKNQAPQPQAAVAQRTWILRNCKFAQVKHPMPMSTPPVAPPAMPSQPSKSMHQKPKPKPTPPALLQIENRLVNEVKKKELDLMRQEFNKSRQMKEISPAMIPIKNREIQNKAQEFNFERQELQKNKQESDQSKRGPGPDMEPEGEEMGMGEIAI